MPETNQDMNYLQQKDICGVIESCFRGTQWIPVDDSFSEMSTRTGLFGELVPNDKIGECLSKTGWDLMRADLGPECSIIKENGKVQISYSRLTPFSDIEPIVIPRNFFGLLQGYDHLSEEYVLFHNLYHDVKNGVFLKLDGSGNSEPATRVENGEFLLKRKYLRNYLGVKGMSLIVQFNSARYSSIPLSEIPSEDRRQSIVTEDYSYMVNIVEDEMETIPGSKTLSVLYGKTVVRGYPPNKCTFGIFEEEEEFPDFIIDLSEDDEEILASCDPELLDRKKPEGKSYLTPVYFNQDVMQKYYADESKYSVEDGYLRCGSLWGLRMDNHNSDYIIVYLGDLSGDLPQDEREYWKAFNIPPQGGLSHTSFKRDILGEFADPEKEDFRFKLEYGRFKKLWESAEGWPLYLPLNAGDKHVLKHLRIPLKNVSSEFDQQILYLSKMLIDSLNEKQISQNVSGLPDGCKGISKLEILLSEMEYSNAGDFIKFLRSLQSVRSKGAAHRKGKSYEKSLEHLGVDKSDYIESFSSILRETTGHITDLVRYICE